MRILVISLAGIGDTLIATPLIRELARSFPGAKLEAFVLWKGSRDLLEGNRHLKTIHQLNLMQAGTVGTLRFLSSLRARRFDVSINTHPQSRIHYRIIARLIDAPIRISHRYDNHTPLDRFLVNRSVPQDYSVHGVENNLRLLRLLNKEPDLSAADQEVPLTEAHGQWASQFLKQQRLDLRQRLGIHPGSGGTKNLALKRWPLENYCELARRLTAANPALAIILFGGPEEASDHARIQQAGGANNVLVSATPSLCHAAALMRYCHAFLSVDTALMHLAAAMKVSNQLVIEAPTLNLTNVPYRNPYRLIKNPAVAGRNLEYYRYDGKPIKGSEHALRRLMESVSVDKVLASVQEALKG